MAPSINEEPSYIECANSLSGAACLHQVVYGTILRSISVVTSPLNFSHRGYPTYLRHFSL
jgi:hypothetical protein